MLADEVREVILSNRINHLINKMKEELQYSITTQLFEDEIKYLVSKGFKVVQLAGSIKEELIYEVSCR